MTTELSNKLHKNITELSMKLQNLNKVYTEKIILRLASLTIGSIMPNFSQIKHQSDVIQQWDLAYYCHSTITQIKNQTVCQVTLIKYRKMGTIFFACN